MTRFFSNFWKIFKK